MRKTYTLRGMTCASCETKVTKAINDLEGVINVQVNKDAESAVIESSGEISLDTLATTLKGLDSKYSIENNTTIVTADRKHTLTTYKPIILVFLYITVVTGVIQWRQDQPDMMQWMRHFMAGFFLVFSFFKLLDLSGFADSYSAYDIIAKHWRGWAYIYALIELGLGIAYLLDCCPLATNITAFCVMTISIIGVLQSVLNNQKIQCACLGAVFDLPMSTVTIIEDVLMIMMSGGMIWTLLAR